MEDEDNIDQQFPIIHIRIQQLRRKKCLTKIEGIPDIFDFKKMLKYWKKNYSCGGSIQKFDEPENADKEYISLTGDHRDDIAEFLEQEGITIKENIRIHGI